MIKSFKNKGLERFAAKGDASKISVQNLDRLRRILVALDEAARPGDMDIPGWRYHPLTGPMKGRHAVTVNGPWRITWAWNDGAVDVDLEQYH